METCTGVTSLTLINSTSPFFLLLSPSSALLKLLPLNFVDNLEGKLLVTVLKAKLAAFIALVAELGIGMRIRLCFSSMTALTEQRTLDTTHRPKVMSTMVKLTAIVLL